MNATAPKEFSLKKIHCIMLFVKQALYASKIVSYAQGFMLMREAAKEFKWTLNYGGIALMWRGGCIIRRLVNEKVSGGVGWGHGHGDGTVGGCWFGVI